MPGVNMTPAIDRTIPIIIEQERAVSTVVESFLLFLSPNARAITTDTPEERPLKKVITTKLMKVAHSLTAACAVSPT